MQKPLSAALLTITALAIIAAACSSGGSDDAAPQTPSPSTTDTDGADADQAQPASSLADSDVGQPVFIVSPFPEDSTLSTIFFEDGTSFRFEGTRDAEGLPESVAAVIIANRDNRAVARFDPLGRVVRLEMNDGASAESGAIEFAYGSDSIDLQFFASSTATEPSGNATIQLEDFPDVVEQLEQLSVTGLLDRATSRPVLLSDTTPTRGASPAAARQTAPSRLRLTTHVRHADGSPVSADFALEWQTRQPLPATRLDEAIPDFIRRGELQATAEPGVFSAEISLLVPLTPAQIAANCDAALSPNTAGGANVFIGLTALSALMAETALVGNVTPVGIGAGVIAVGAFLVRFAYFDAILLLQNVRAGRSLQPSEFECKLVGDTAEDYETFFEWSVLSLITASDRLIPQFAEFVSGSTHPDVGRISDDDAEPFANTDEIRNASFGPFIEVEQFLTLPPTLTIVATLEDPTAPVDQPFTVSLRGSGGSGPYTWIFEDDANIVDEGPTAVGAGGNAADGGQAFATYIFQEQGTQVLTYLLRDEWGTVVEASLVVPVGNVSIAAVTPSHVRIDGRFGQTVSTTLVTISGTGFRAGAELTIGGRSFQAPDVVVAGEGRIFFNLPVDPTGQAGFGPGVYDVELRTDEGTALLPAALTVSEAPHFDLVGRTVSIEIGPNETNPRELPMYRETLLLTLDFRDGTVRGSFEQSTGEGLVNSTEESDSTGNYTSEIFARVNNSRIDFTSGTLPDGTPLARLEPNSPLFSNVTAGGVRIVDLRLVLTPEGGAPDSQGDTLLIQTSGTLQIDQWDAASEKLRGTLTLREAPASGQIFSTGAVVIRYQVEFDFSAEQMALVEGTP